MGHSDEQQKAAPDFSGYAAFYADFSP